MVKGLRAFFWKVEDYFKSNPKKLNNIIASRDGKLYEIRESAIGRIAYEKREIRELDLIERAFQFSLPKIPGEYLETILSFFRAYCNEFEQNEVMIQIYWDKLMKQYLLECPYQIVSKASIDAEFDPVIHQNYRYVEVVQIHSHNTMRAFFSKTDNENEKAFLLYGVVGNLHDFEPDIRLRAGVNGEYVDLPISYIFDQPVLHNVKPFPKEWHQRVTIKNKERWV